MSGSPDEDKLEELRQQKMEQLQERAESQQSEASQEAAQQQAEAQKNALLRQHLTDDARKRLNTVKMSKPQFGEQVEQQVVSLARSGRIQGQIDDDKMKQLLKELKPDSQSFDIQRR
ncbi:DNA-binding protein [Natrinema gelatinilyticum]|uniref:DNA-binding protein n=1 Tax=Natrinema gelatinilyticum TaxID=2961571 RepID=UPI0020C30CE9|nr:DNA-binding protein [Natrinema gelatinilyticum]